jgi:hypothetical protein
MLHYSLLMAQRDHLVSGDGVPVLLTVEEAGTLLRIGRTKAYAMAREWRESNGRSGLPVIDLGHVLRVPRRALEEMVGAEFSTLEKESSTKANREPRQSEPVKAIPNRNRQNRIADQLDLFDSRTGKS